MIDIQKLPLHNTKRTIITSDIHANLDLFKKLLTKVNYTEEDTLIINGDFCEKGPNSLELVNFVRELTKSNRNVFLTKGNCDVVFRYVFDENEGIIPYMQKRKHSVLNEMMAFYNKSLDDFASLKELGTFYREKFSDVIDWIESLPTAIETEEYIIIHAGIDRLADWRETSETTALYLKAFQEQGHQANKTVIVGHWPVVNYRANQVSSHNPYIDLEKRIISIDGGNQIKADGQLNALIIEEGNISYTFSDRLEREVIINETHVDSIKRIGTVTYPNYEMNIIKQDKYFTLCENINLGLNQWIKNEYLLKEENRLFCKDDLSTTFLSVQKGEKVKKVDDSCAGYTLIKKNNGEVGWVPKQNFNN